LAELWAIKMQINEEANFSLDTIAARARAFKMKQAKARISLALNPAQPKSTAERTQHTPG
jgi:hypothetical protein